MSARIAAVTGVAALALLAAGCGGGEGGGSTTGSLPDGASIAPKGSALFLSMDTDFDSDQWKQTAALFGKFPGGPKLLAQVQKELKGFPLADLKSALGPELDVVLVDFVNGGDDTVVMTKTKDPAKLKALMAESESDSVSEQVEGWTVVANSRAQLDRFDTARKDGVLSESDAFTEAMQQLPGEAAAKLYLEGGKVQAGLEKSLQGSGIPSGSASDFGSIRSIAAAAVAEKNGVSLDGDVAATVKAKTETYAPELPSLLPSGALLLVSFAHLDQPIRQVLDSVKRSQPRLQKQLDLFQGVAGLSLEGDLLPILAGEGAIVVYPSEPRAKIPAISLVLKLEDEAKVKNLLDRLATVLRLSGNVKVTSAVVDGVPVKKFDVQRVTLLAGVFDGMLVVTNGASVIKGLHSNGDKLVDDPQYSQAADDAGLPDEVLGFAYADLKSGLPDVFSLVESAGETIPPEVRTNTKPLQSLLLYASGDADRFSFGGFLTLK